jgi:ATP-dependent RNA helicase RhlB
MKDNHLTKIKFSSLNIDPLIIKGINDLNFEFCTPIQSESLPIALQGKDVAGQAQTGTGKTAAFLISAIQRIIENDSSGKEKKQPRIFILAPTRELAIQIAKDAEAIGRHTNLKIGLAYGGTDYEKQSSTITTRD